jgi:phage-related protein
LRTTGLFVSFFVFIVDLGFRDYSLSRLSASSGQDHLEGPLWEIRMKGKDGISRALYVTARQKRVVIVRVFIKKTEKTPRREIEIALTRAMEVSNDKDG